MRIFHVSNGIRSHQRAKTFRASDRAATVIVLNYLNTLIRYWDILSEVIIINCAIFTYVCIIILRIIDRHLLIGRPDADCYRSYLRFLVGFLNLRRSILGYCGARGSVVG
jgi:hypothetical protein